MSDKPNEWTRDEVERWKEHGHGDVGSCLRIINALLDQTEKAERERDEYAALLKDDNGVGALKRELELLRELHVGAKTLQSRGDVVPLVRALRILREWKGKTDGHTGNQRTPGSGKG